jgi:hypothetical protein
MKQNSSALIEATANAIKDHFIPKNKDEESFSFHFTIPPSSNYKANYKKDAKGNWILIGCESVE